MKSKKKTNEKQIFKNKAPAKPGKVIKTREQDHADGIIQQKVK